MATDVVEEDLLRAIEAVETRIKAFRKKVRTVLDSAQMKDNKPEDNPQSQA